MPILLSIPIQFSVEWSIFVYMFNDFLKYEYYYITKNNYCFRKKYNQQNILCEYVAEEYSNQDVPSLEDVSNVQLRTL